jgi:hypothetical protein
LIGKGNPKTPIILGLLRSERRTIARPYRQNGQSRDCEQQVPHRAIKTAQARKLLANIAVRVTAIKLVRGRKAY